MTCGCSWCVTENASVTMATSRNGNTFRITGPLREGTQRCPVDFPHKKQVMWSFDISFDVSLHKLLNKQSRCMPWWSFDTLKSLAPENEKMSYIFPT